MDHLKFIIPGKPEYLTMVRLAISSIAASAGFDVEMTEDIKTAVCEACKTIACHGYTNLSDKYDVECSVGEGMIEIVVKDECVEHTIEKECSTCYDCPNNGDLSSFVIESLMDSVEFAAFDDGRKIIRMVKKA